MKKPKKTDNLKTNNPHIKPTGSRENLKRKKLKNKRSGRV